MKAPALMNNLKNLLKIFSFLFILCLLNTEAYGYDFNVLDLNEVTIDYNRFKDGGRDYFVYPDPPKEKIDLNFNLAAINGYLYWNNGIEAYTTSDQYRSVGLELSIGVHVTESLDIGFYHHSAHTLDEPNTLIPSYLEEDALNIKVYLYKGKNKNSIF